MNCPECGINNFHIMPSLNGNNPKKIQCQTCLKARMNFLENIFSARSSAAERVTLNHCGVGSTPTERAS